MRIKAANCGDLIDKMYLQDKEIDKIEAVLKKEKQARSDIEAQLFATFDKQKLNGARGKRASAKIVETKHASIKDRLKFEKYIYKHKAFDLFQARVMNKAYFDRLEEGENVPGVSIYTSTRISVTKVR